MESVYPCEKPRDGHDYTRATSCRSVAKVNANIVQSGWPTKAKIAVAMRRVSWGPVLVPFTLSRILLLIVGWFSQYFPADPARPFHLIQQGFAATPNRLIDIWFRSDSAYYMSIVTIDYPGVADLANTQSNFGFFPLYPCLLRPFLLGTYNLTGSYDLVLLLGIVISNLL